MSITKLKSQIVSVSGQGGRSDFIKLKDFGNELKRMYSFAAQDAPDDYKLTMRENDTQLVETMGKIEVGADGNSKEVLRFFSEYKEDLITAVDDLIKFVERNNLSQKFL